MEGLAPWHRVGNPVLASGPVPRHPHPPQSRPPPHILTSRYSNSPVPSFSSALGFIMEICSTSPCAGSASDPK